VADVDLALDRLVHEPGRLAILTVLSSVTDADFLFLQRATGLTKGNLSSHLTKLEDGGLVAIEKRFVGKRPNTKVAITPTGRERVARHWEQLERLKTLGDAPAPSSAAPRRHPAKAEARARRGAAARASG
jgi:DNA-binding transcriptional ArsR family regulator